MNMDALKSKKVVLITAALLLFLGTGGAVYYALRNISPRDDGMSNSPEPSSKGELLQKANESDEAAQAALADNDPATAAKKFAEAKELYTKAGEGEQATQAGQQQTVAEQEAAAANSNEEVAPPRRALR
jgi:hypothetical protein